MASNSAPVTDPAAGDQADFLAAVEEGLADAKAGRMVSYDEVRRWLLSWGSESELPPPKCP